MAHVVMICVAQADFTTVQKSGTCYYKSIIVALRYMLRRLGVSLAHYKLLKRMMRLLFLHRVHVDLQYLTARYGNAGAAARDGVAAAIDEDDEELGPLHSACALLDSDVRLIQIGCTQLSKTVLKAVHSGDSLSEELSTSMELIRVRARACTCRCLRVHGKVDGCGGTAGQAIQHEVSVAPRAGSAFSTPALLNMTESTPFQPMVGVTHLLENRPTHKYSGGTATVPPGLFARLLYPHYDGGTSPGGSWIVGDVAFRCHQQCNALRGKVSTASRALIMHQIVALVEHVFTRVMPLPQLPASCGQDLPAGSPWSVRVDHVTLQNVLQVHLPPPVCCAVPTEEACSATNVTPCGRCGRRCSKYSHNTPVQ